MTRKTKRRLLYGGLTTLGLVLTTMFLFPIHILLINSFKNQKGIFVDVLGWPDKATFTLKNYAESFRKMEYLSAFSNSLWITVVATLCIVGLCSAAAWALVRRGTKLSTTVFFLFAGAMLIPFQCLMLPLVKVMSELGFMTRPGLIFMYIGFGSPLTIVMLHGFVKNIPLELEEAAVIDGCGYLTRFFRIVFPLLRTIVISVTVLNVMWLWNDFLLPSLVINKAGWQTLPLRTYLFFGQFSKRWDLATAALIMSMIPIIVFYLFAQKYVVKGITDGAIK